MKRIFSWFFALLTYTIGMLSCLYLCGFMLNLIVPKGIDTGPVGDTGQSLLENLAILVVFLVLHSIMARRGFKEWLTKIVPAPLERATYILLSGVTLLITLWLWQPIPFELWSLEAGLPAFASYTIYAFGWSMIVISTFSVDHFAFFGLRQVWEAVVDAPPKHRGLSQSWFYALVRHPISVGWMLVFLSTAVMTVGHLIFAAVMVVYILIVTPIEEREI